MSYKYILLAEAQDEYEVAVNWYLERSAKAAKNFLDAVDATLELIREHPDRWKNEVGRFRELGVKRYPCNIVYSVDDDSGLVVVRAVYHHSRNPKMKYRGYIDV